jgi:heme-degrading monooxygenase HmoA
MNARSTTIRGNRQALDDAISYMRDEVMPAMQEMDGFMGLSMLCERDTGRCIATSAWTDEQTMRASAEKIHPMRERLVQVFGGEPEVQEWEVAVMHRERPTGEGACARVTWVRARPGQEERLIEHYRTSVMPRLRQMSGVCSFSMLVDRQDGRGVGTLTFESREAMEQTREEARSLREEATGSGAVEMMDIAEMDLVLAHLRVPETV